MPVHQFRLRWLVWLALAAMLMSALAPSISRTIAVARGDASADICRAGFIKTGDTASMPDCPYCLPHAAHYALPPAEKAALGLFDRHVLRPFLFYRAPKPLLALTAAPPRGPPAA